MIRVALVIVMALSSLIIHAQESINVSDWPYGTCEELENEVFNCMRIVDDPSSNDFGKAMLMDKALWMKYLLSLRRDSNLVIIESHTKVLSGGLVCDTIPSGLIQHTRNLAHTMVLVPADTSWQVTLPSFVGFMEFKYHNGWQ